MTEVPTARIPILVEPTLIPDGIPSEYEIFTAVDHLKRNKAPGPSGIRAEDLKTWKKDYLNALTEMEEEQNEEVWQRMSV